MEELKGRWRARPTEVAAYSWLAALYKSPLIAVPTFWFATLDDLIDRPWAGYVLITAYITPMAFLFFASVSAVSAVAVHVAARKGTLLPVIFWLSFVSAHIFRALYASGLARLWFNGIDGPGTGPTLEATCEPNVMDDPKCHVLIDVANRSFKAAAIITFIIFGYELSSLLGSSRYRRG